MRAYVELERALRAGDVPRARAALGGRAGFPNLNDPYTNTPLLALALSWAPADAVEELLDLGADPNFEARDGFPALLGVILSERDDKHVLFDDDCETPLELAARVGKRRAAAALEPGTGPT